MMTVALQIARMAAWLSLAILFVSLADLARQTPTLLREEAGITREAIDSRIAAEADITRIMLDNRMRDALGEVRTATAVVNLRSGQAIDELAATRRMVAVVGLNLAGRADSRAGEVTAALSEIAKLRQDAQPVIQSATRTIEQIEEAAPMFLDCDHNSDCAFNRYVGVTSAAENTARELQRAVPGLLRTADEIAAGVKRTTDSSAEASGHLSATFANLEKQSKPLPLAMRFAPQAVQAILIAIGLLKL